MMKRFLEMLKEVRSLRKEKMRLFGGALDEAPMTAHLACAVRDENCRGRQ